MKRRIVFATGNENKMKEIRMILSDLNTEIVSMKEAGVDIDIVEDGMSFEENAEIKARSVARILTNVIREGWRMTSGFLISIPKNPKESRITSGRMYSPCGLRMGILYIIYPIGTT